METLAEVPAVVAAITILVSNLFSGHPGSRRWEVITALFGYTAGDLGGACDDFPSRKYFSYKRRGST